MSLEHAETIYHQRTTKYFDQHEVAELAAWMLDGFPFDDTSDPSNRGRYTGEWSHFGPPLQEKANEALFTALATWSPEIHGLDTLSDLVYTAGVTQNTKTIPALTSLIDSRALPDDDDDHETKGFIIAVVAGFAQEPQAQEALLQWYNDPEFPWEYTANIALGLMRGIPENSITYIRHLLQTIGDHPHYFRFDILTCEMAATIGVDCLEQILKDSTGFVAPRLLAFIPDARDILSGAIPS